MGYEAEFWEKERERNAAENAAFLAGFSAASYAANKREDNTPAEAIAEGVDDVVLFGLVVVIWCVFGLVLKNVFGIDPSGVGAWVVWGGMFLVSLALVRKLFDR